MCRQQTVQQHRLCWQKVENSCTLRLRSTARQRAERDRRRLALLHPTDKKQHKTHTDIHSTAACKSLLRPLQSIAAMLAWHASGIRRRFLGSKLGIFPLLVSADHKYPNLSNDDCMEDKVEDYQNCSVLYEI